MTTADGVLLAVREHTPAQPRTSTPLLLLHGLAGHRGEWDEVAELLLADGHRVLSYDARGHGDSTRRPGDMTRAACVRDAVAVVEQLTLPQVVLVGQSLGGHTALLTAAARPDLVRALVLVEAGPDGEKQNPNLPAEIGSWVDGWPVPFEEPSRATEFFGHPAWAGNLERRSDGWYPKVDRDAMVAAVAELATTSYWADWERLCCPTLVVRGARGTMRVREFEEMRDRRPAAAPATEFTVVPDAGHDVHLDRPGELHAAMAAFLGDLGL